VSSYIHQLTDEYKSFIFLLLHVLPAFPDGETPKQANYIAQISHTTPISHTSSNPQYNLQQAKVKQVQKYIVHDK
jgi:hypothetical protein